MKTVITVRTVITNAADTASCPDDVTVLQGHVTEDVNWAGTPTFVSKVGGSILL